jgi:hypothetical protein
MGTRDSLLPVLFKNTFLHFNTSSKDDLIQSSGSTGNTFPYILKIVTN